MSTKIYSPAVQTLDVVKQFGHGSKRVRALDGVTLEVADNEFFTLLGPSGCGKTTLLRLIAGFEQPTAGEVFLYGDEIEELPPHKRSVNTVFQHYALFPHMSVGENVAFGLHMLKRPAGEITKRVAEALALAKMEAFVDRKPSQLSGGQQQRVALARALAPQPKVLLLDEPLSALDLKLRQAMRLELKTLQRDTGITFIFVTHDQEEALTMSDRIAVMSNGNIQQIGSPLMVYEQPENRFVADFIGDTNFLSGRLESLDQDIATCSVGNTLTITVNRNGQHKVGESVTLAVRPEKMVLQNPDAASSNATHANRINLQGRVRDVVYIGTDTRYSVQVDNDVVLSVRDANKLDGGGRFVAGDNVQVSVDSAAIRMLAD